MNENVVINFESETSGLDKVLLKLKEILGIHDKASVQFKKNQKEEADLLIKTNGALNVLEANLKSLRDERQRAFDPKQIKDFNVQIAETERAINKLKTAGLETNKGFDAFKSTLKDLAVAFGLAFSIDKIIEFGKASIKAFEEAEAAAKQLEFAVKGINKESDAAVDTLKALAFQFSALNNQSIFDDDDIVKAQAALATFGLTSKEIEKLLPNLIDAASVTGDLTATTETFIQAINGQTRGLKQLGVNFKDTGDQTENFNLLIEKTNKLHGQAAAALETEIGQAKAYEARIGSLSESLGEKLAPALNKLKVALLEIGNDIADSFLGNDARAIQLERIANEQRIARFKGYNDALRKAAIEDTEENIETLKKKALADRQGTEAQRESVDVTLAKIKANEELLKSMKALIDEEKRVVPTNLGLTEEEKAKRAAQAEEARKKEIENRKKLSDEIIAIQKQLSAEIDKIEKDRLKEEIKRRQEFTKSIIDQEKDLAEQKAELDKKVFQQQEEDFKLEQQRIEARTQAIITSFQNIADAAFQISSNNRASETDAQLRYLEEQREKELSNKNLTEAKKKAIQDKYDREEAAVKLKAWKANQHAAELQAAINGALAITNILANMADPTITQSFKIAAIATSIIATAAQLAVIESQKPPQFAKGTKNAPKGWAWVGEEGPELVQLKGGEEIKTHAESVKFAAMQFPDLRIAPNNININTKGIIDYDRLAKALSDELSGLDDLRKLNETNHLLYVIASRMNNNIDIRRN